MGQGSSSCRSPAPTTPPPHHTIPITIQGACSVLQAMEGGWSGQIAAGGLPDRACTLPVAPGGTEGACDGVILSLTPASTMPCALPCRRGSSSSDDSTLTSPGDSAGEQLVQNKAFKHLYMFILEPRMHTGVPIKLGVRIVGDWGRRRHWRCMITLLACRPSV